MTSKALEELVPEHAALRRVATLVARQPSPSEVFAAVTREVGMLLRAQRATLLRVDSPARAEVVASWSDAPRRACRSATEERSMAAASGRDAS